MARIEQDKKAQAQLQVESHRIRYRLRSTFFYRKLKEYNTLAFPSMIASLFSVENLYDWQDRASWGISEDAFNYIVRHQGFKLIQVFCHPKLLREYPMLVAYYRNIAALSQKSVKYLVGIDVTVYEANGSNKRQMTDTHAFLLARLFNEHVSLIIDSSIQSLTEQELGGLLLISTGAQIDGAWRNAIGEEAEKVIQRLLVKEAVERGLLFGLMPRNGTKVELYRTDQYEELLGNIGRYRGIHLNNQTSLIFSSEPDISLIGKHGNTLGVIEVKGGDDPAGALERYGAAKKSFEETRRSALMHKPFSLLAVLQAKCRTALTKIKRSLSILTLQKSSPITKSILDLWSRSFLFLVSFLKNLYRRADLHNSFRMRINIHRAIPQEANQRYAGRIGKFNSKT